MQKGFVKKENQSKRTFSFVSFFNSFHFFVCAADEPRFLIGRPPSNQSKPLRHGSDPTPTAGIGERGEGEGGGGPWTPCPSPPSNQVIHCVDRFSSSCANVHCINNICPVVRVCTGVYGCVCVCVCVCVCRATVAVLLFCCSFHRPNIDFTAVYLVLLGFTGFN